MISNFFELGSFAFAILTAYELSGRVAAFAVIAFVLLIIGLALDGVKVKIPRLKKPEPPKRKLSAEPLTNAKLDQQ